MNTHLTCTAECINILGKFCGKRDLNLLTTDELQHKFQITKADVAILFGGSIIAGGDVFAQIIKHKLAKKYMIVGGSGHTTQTLLQTMQQLYPELYIGDVSNLSEAECFSRYLDGKYHLSVNFLEKKSTNCGNNITFCLDMLHQHGIYPKSILFVQDATMQHRMDAGFRKYVASEVKLINYAAYQAEIIVSNNQLVYAEKISGMWTIERYLSLLLGEIPRLQNDVNGYGPRGKNFIAKVHIPTKVLTAYEILKKNYGNLIRQANDKYAKPQSI